MKTRLVPLALFALYFQPCDAADVTADSGGPQVLEAPPASVYGYRAEQVADGVYTLNQGNDFHLQPRGNVGIVLQSKGVVLVDSGGSPDGAEQVIAFVRSLTEKPVTGIILTHWHGDHALGVSRLLEAWPDARVISTHPTRDMLSSPDADRFMPGDDPAANAAYRANIESGLNYLRGASMDLSLSEAEREGFAQAALEYEQFGREMARARRVAPTETFDLELKFEDETHPLEVRFPGRANTAGDAIAWLPQQAVVFTGDIVVLPIPYGFNSYPEGWAAALQQINALGYRVLVPGHGRPLHDSAYVDMLMAMLNDVRAQVAGLAPTEMDAAAVSGAIDLDTASVELAGDDPWLRRWFGAYWQGPVVSSALREARGEAIIQGAD